MDYRWLEENKEYARKYNNIMRHLHELMETLDGLACCMDDDCQSEEAAWWNHVITDHLAYIDCAIQDETTRACASLMQCLHDNRNKPTEAKTDAGN